MMLSAVVCATTAPETSEAASAKTTNLMATRYWLLAGVDLRSLQGSGVVDVDRLPLAEDIDPGHARLAVAVAGLLRSAERQMHFRADGRRVHVEDPGVHVAHGQERFVHVARVDR